MIQWILIFFIWGNGPMSSGMNVTFQNEQACKNAGNLSVKTYNSMYLKTREYISAPPTAFICVPDR